MVERTLKNERTLVQAWDGDKIQSLQASGREC